MRVCVGCVAMNCYIRTYNLLHQKVAQCVVLLVNSEYGGIGYFCVFGDDYPAQGKESS